ncbi:MAG TPA: ABC transporter permease [Bacteroidales bacterium]|nr:ABC transporter permease [Bacteroidales bacterium]
MFKQLFTLTLRNILKDKIFALLTLTNLMVGFATFILLSLYVNGELNWDKHNVNYNRIYRLQLFMDQSENVEKNTMSVTAALSRHDLSPLPEIEKIALIHDVGDNNKDGIFFSVNKINQFKIRYGYFADPSVFDIFTFHFVEGNPATALSRPMSIVLSKSVADKLFPKGNALGKQVFGENKANFMVTGVYADVPENSSWRPVYLLPMISFAKIANWEGYENDYWSYSFCTYVLLKNNAQSSSVDAKIHGALHNFRKEHYPYLRPLSQLHLNPFFQNDIYIGFSLIAFIAILILVLSSINFINLQTANATTRLREIGIKKTVGFTRNQLRNQFLIESVIVAFISGMLGLLLAQVLLPVFCEMFNLYGVESVVSNWQLLCILLAVMLLTGVLSGLYPAWVISRFNPVQALKQKFIQNESRGFSFKNVLVTLQFSISLFLLISGFVIFRQTRFMITSDHGFTSENLLYATLSTDKKGSFQPIRQRLLGHHEIVDACYSSYIPFILPGGDDLDWEGSHPGEKVFFRVYDVSHDFFSTYGIKIMNGRNFTHELLTDNNKCLINATAVSICRWQNPLGKHIRLWGKTMEVIGVVNDFTANSVHTRTEPHIFRLVNDSANLSGIYTLRFVAGNEQKAMQIIKTEFRQSFPQDAFEFRNFRYLIVNENALQAWKNFSKISLFFALISIFISSVGLFGLVMFFTKRRMKEIGIRKVFGFSFMNLYLHLSSSFLKLIAISILIAWPAGYYIYNVLPGAHKYPLQIWEFLLATLIILAVALITISYQMIKAANANPVEVLKEE